MHITFKCIRSLQTVVICVSRNCEFNKTVQMCVFDVFLWHVMLVVSIGAVYALVMVIYFCKRNLEKYESERIWNNLMSYCPSPYKQSGRTENPRSLEPWESGSSEAVEVRRSHGSRNQRSPQSSVEVMEARGTVVRKKFSHADAQGGRRTANY